MTQQERIELLARLAKKEVRVEYVWTGRPSELSFNENGELVDDGGHVWAWGIPLQYELRIKKSIPLLSPEDLDFSEKYLPHDWWITRDKDGELFIYQSKPDKLNSQWKNISSCARLGRPYIIPQFTDVKWEDDYCYTVQELIDNAKK